MTLYARKRILWILGITVPTYVLFIPAYWTITREPEPSFAVFLTLWVALADLILFLWLLRSERSALWNGIIAFLFWMPAVGWSWLEPNAELIQTRNVGDGVVEMLKRMDRALAPLVAQKTMEIGEMVILQAKEDPADDNFEMYL